MNIITRSTKHSPAHYTYFLHVPPKSDECFLHVIGWKDGTSVEVYEIKPDGTQVLLVTETVNRMECKALMTLKPENQMAGSSSSSPQLDLAYS